MQRNGTGDYLVCMEIRYHTLRLLWELVQEAPQPTQYQCMPRELILRSQFDWANIYTHLVSLEKEGLVVIMQADTLQFSITQKGLDKAALIQFSEAGDRNIFVSGK